MLTKDLITFRKLSLTRALVLRLGYAWLRRVRTAGIEISALDFCTPGVWTPAMDELEAFMRNYGFVDALDDIGPSKELSERIRKVLERDLAVAKICQLPSDHETAGSERTVSGRPHGLLSLADRMAAEFNMPTLKDSMPVEALTIYEKEEGPAYLAPNAAEKLVARLSAQGFPVDHYSLRTQLARAAREDKRKKSDRTAKQRARTGAKKGGQGNPGVPKPRKVKLVIPASNA
jgi:hypothetical protein